MLDDGLNVGSLVGIREIRPSLLETFDGSNPVVHRSVHEGELTSEFERIQIGEFERFSIRREEGRGRSFGLSEGEFPKGCGSVGAEFLVEGKKVSFL